jgi:ribosomal protein S18 acetylase RimI-like enzyme
MIRSVSPSDVGGFIECYIEVFKTLYETLPEDYVKREINEASTEEYHQEVINELKDCNNILLIALQENEIAGMAWGNVKEDSGWLSFMGVKMPFRGKGIGRSLLNRFIDEVRIKGASKVSLDTDPSLVPAITLYESEGFKKHGKVVTPRGLELILFSKSLVEESV